MALLPVLLAILQTSKPAGPVNVFAAASLKGAFTSIARAFETEHPGSKVNLNFGGSQLLAAQINQGAPADVFASAAMKNLEDVKFDKSSLRVFALNRLVIAVRTGLHGIASPRDLGRAQRIVIADKAVPVGSYTEVFFDRASKSYGASWLVRVKARIVSKEVDVKAVLAKVQLGEADAGIVYVSDAATAKGKVQAVAIPDQMNTIATYPVAMPLTARNKDGSKDFVKFLFTKESQKTLENSGFISPIRPVKEIVIEDFSDHRRFSFPGMRLYPAASATVTGPHNSTEQVTGIPLADLLFSTKVTGIAFADPHSSTKAKTATFIAADSYSQTLSLEDLRTRKALLVKRPDGNWQLIVPGMKPNTWVQWIRRIELR